MTGLLGIAEKIDRHNEDRSDMAVTLSDELAWAFRSSMSEDASIRFEETVSAIAHTGAHELGHILGLEHATEINTNAPNNLMNYNTIQVRLGQREGGEELEERNSYRQFAAQQGSDLLDRQIGFENEIDLLLRYIGEGTPIGL